MPDEDNNFGGSLVMCKLRIISFMKFLQCYTIL